jgi:Uma2 family endonuclease
LLGNLLVSGPCAVFNSDLRVVVMATGLTTYPDVTVVCGPRDLHPEDEHAITNPRVILEVLSPTTEAYDRGAKFAHYQSVPSLEEYVLVASVGRRIEHYRRQPTGQWLLTTYVADDATVELPALGGGVRLGEVYAKVEEPAA